MTDTNKRTLTEDFVNNIHLQLLGRFPDEDNKNEYIDAILDGTVDPEQFEYIIKNSDEHIERENRKNSKTHLERGTMALCIMGYKNGMEYIKESINVAGKFVDEIHIQGDDFGEDDAKIFEELGKNIGRRIDIHIVPWIDNFSYYKNKCVSWANTDWILILDHDEIPTKEMVSNIKSIIDKSNMGIDYDMVSFDVIDVKTVKGDIMSEHRNNGGKPLFHRNIPEPYCGNPHIWLKSSYYPWIAVHDNTAYRHVKDLEEELVRSVRNIFMGGGGDSVKEGNPNWVTLRSMCNELGIDTYKQFDDYLKKGDINKRVLSILKKFADMPWKDNELKDLLRYYYLLHPDEED